MSKEKEGKEKSSKKLPLKTKKEKKADKIAKRNDKAKVGGTYL